MSSSNPDNLKISKHSPAFQKAYPQHRRILLLGEKIYGRRKDLKLTQTELAVKAGTTQRIISELEDGAYAPKQGIGEELYNRLSVALEIDRDYLFSDKVDRRSFELFAYLGQKLHWEWDIMQFMKLPYFVDLQTMKELGFQITNLKYVRYEYGPFDKKIYAYRALFEDKKYDVEFSYIKDFIASIECALEDLPMKNGNALKKLSYETEPMKKIQATLGKHDAWLEELDLKAN